MRKIKRKLLLALCVCLVIGMAPMAVYAYPGDGGNVLEHMYTDKDLTYEENATVFIYATPGACEIVDEGGKNSTQHYRVSNFDGWYFEGFKTWYIGREYHWIFPDANEVNKENPKFDNGEGYYFSKYKIHHQKYTPNTYAYEKERISVNKEADYRGTYYLYAIFRPILTVNAGDGVTYKVNGAYQITNDYGVIVEGQHAVAYNSAATVTYTVDSAYEVTGVSASYGTSYSVSGQSITVSGMVRPGSISINTVKKHVHDYSSDWSKDDSKHWRKCSCGEVTDEGEHIGGTATCSTKAECSVCETEYGMIDKEKHINTEVRGTVEPEEFNDGYTGDVYCKDCGDLITSGKVIPATHQHSYSETEWDGDGSNHWQECTCGERFGTTSHSGGTAACNSQAVCTVCSKPYGVVDKTNHSGGTEVKGYIAVTEFSNGYTGDTYCKGCQTLLKKGKAVPATHQHSYSSNWSTDQAIHWHECSCGARIDAAGHTFTEATCTEPMECTVCGMISGTAAGHDYADPTCDDPSTCKECGETTGEPLGHDYKDGICQSCGEEDPDYVPPTDPADPVNPENATGPSDKAGPADKDASIATGDDRSNKIWWFLLLVAALSMRRVVKGKRK